MPTLGVSLAIIGLVILRVYFGALLINHGYPKLASMRKGTQDWLASMKLPRELATLVGILEFLGGILLIVGLITRIVSLLFAIEFLGIVFNRTRLGKKKLSDYEVDLLYLGFAFAMIFLGSGPISLNYLLHLNF